MKTVIKNGAQAPCPAPNLNQFQKSKPHENALFQSNSNHFKEKNVHQNLLPLQPAGFSKLDAESARSRFSTSGFDAEPAKSRCRLSGFDVSPSPPLHPRVFALNLCRFLKLSTGF
jgi:hypothetical protein